jgi:hypothetical protein
MMLLGAALYWASATWITIRWQDGLIRRIAFLCFLVHALEWQASKVLLFYGSNLASLEQWILQDAVAALMVALHLRAAWDYGIVRDLRIWIFSALLSVSGSVAICIGGGSDPLGFSGLQHPLTVMVGARYGIFLFPALMAFATAVVGTMRNRPSAMVSALLSAEIVSALLVSSSLIVGWPHPGAVFYTTYFLAFAPWCILAFMGNAPRHDPVDLRHRGMEGMQTAPQIQ